MGKSEAGVLGYAKTRQDMESYRERQRQEAVLMMDHIDGNPYFHDESNLRLICPNCNALLPTYKARNKGRGRGRVARRQRSSDGRAADL